MEIYLKKLRKLKKIHKKIYRKYTLSMNNLPLINY